MKNIEFKNQEDIEFQEDIFDFKKITEKLIAKWYLFLIFLAGAMIIAFMVNRYTVPVYIVEANLLIKSDKEITNATSNLLYDQEFFGRNVINIDNESALLKSRNLIEKTLRDLDINISYYAGGDVRDDELYHRSPIKVTVFPSSESIPNNHIRCDIKDSLTYTLESVEQVGTGQKILTALNLGKQPISLLENTVDLEFGKPYDINGFQFSIELNDQNKKPPQKDIFFKVFNYESLTKQYRSRLSTSPYSVESSVLTISMEGTVPKKTIDFIDRLIDNFIKADLDRKNFNASKTLEFIDRQVKFTGDSLSSIEERLQRFKQATTSLNLSEKGSRLNVLTNQLVNERSTIILTLKYLNDLKTYMSNNDLDQIIAPSSLGLEDPELNRMVRELMDLQSENKIMESDRNLQNPLIRKNRSKIAYLKEDILNSLNSLEVTNNFQLDDINKRLDNVQLSLRNLPAEERELIDIQRTHEISEELYLFLMQKKAEAGIAKASNTVDYRIVDSAAIKGIAPVKPSPTLNYLVAIFSGLALPFILIVISTLVNNKISSSEDLNKLTKIPILGSISHSKANGKNNTDLIAVERPKSAITESFRTIRSNLRYFSNGVSDCKIFLLTSSVSGEGKSFCANNLAYVFSNFGKRVLLINADMRKTYSYQAFGIEANAGLSDYLAGIATKSQVIQATKYRDLFIVTAGKIPPNPSELLINGKLQQLLNEARSDFNYIILDTPPVGLLSDGLELMQCSDVNLYIVRQNYTLKNHINEANNVYNISKGKNMALLLNDVSYKKLKYGYGYYEEDRKKAWWKKAIET